MDTLLVILQSTVPALVVFATVYYLFRGFMRHQWNMAQLDRQKENRDTIFPLKLQAYERLALFCERIRLDNLLYRINNPEMSGQELQQTLMIAIQQEYDHNLTQQIYVSDNLWQIITLCKNQYQALISEIQGQTNAEWIQSAYGRLAELKSSPIDIARQAIKQEADVLLS